MPRYFAEVSYQGKNYSGFQVQKNAASVQGEVERALSVFFRTGFELTGSSRTDAGVHARQNYFHFDTDTELEKGRDLVYHLNAILPPDIVLLSLRRVGEEAHCRFDALSREYHYHIYQAKNPFLNDRAYFFPYKLDMALMQEAAEVILRHTDFTSFSKRNTQVHSFLCEISLSKWQKEEDQLVYIVKGNRFLRGMVRGLVGTMLQVGRGKISINGFEEVIVKKDCTLARFDVPAQGLFLEKVDFPAGIFM